MNAILNINQFTVILFNLPIPEEMIFQLKDKWRCLMLLEQLQLSTIQEQKKMENLC